MLLKVEGEGKSMSALDSLPLCPPHWRRPRCPLRPHSPSNFSYFAHDCIAGPASIGHTCASLLGLVGVLWHRFEYWLDVHAWLFSGIDMTCTVYIAWRNVYKALFQSGRNCLQHALPYYWCSHIWILDRLAHKHRRMQNWIWELLLFMTTSNMPEVSRKEEYPFLHTILPSFLSFFLSFFLPWLPDGNSQIFRM